MNKNIFYVYQYIRLDTNTVFYVGKGKDNRLFNLKRSQWFKNILNKVDCVVEIVLDNLSEEESFYEERNIIEDLVFTEGYGILTSGNTYQKGTPYLVNLTWGGDGSSGAIISESHKSKIAKSSENKKLLMGDEEYQEYCKRHSPKINHFKNGGTEEEWKILCKTRCSVKDKVSSIEWERIKKSYGRPGVKKSNSWKLKVSGENNSNSKKISLHIPNEETLKFNTKKEYNDYCRKTFNFMNFPKNHGKEFFRHKDKKFNGYYYTDD